MFQNVIFDMDGTLLDTLQDIAASGNHTLLQLGCAPHPTDAYRHFVGNGIRNLIIRMLPCDKRDEETIDHAFSIYSDYYGQHMQDFTRPYPQIPEMLGRLSSAGIGMGVVSNKAHAFTQAMAEQYFPGIFPHVVGMQPGLPSKPDAAPVLLVAKKLGTSLDSLLFVGDSDVDMLTARNANVAGCGVSWGFRDEAELVSAGAQMVAHSAKELEEFILG